VAVTAVPCISLCKHSNAERTCNLCRNSPDAVLQCPFLASLGTELKDCACAVVVVSTQLRCNFVTYLIFNTFSSRPLSCLLRVQDWLVFDCQKPEL